MFPTRQQTHDPSCLPDTGASVRPLRRTKVLQIGKFYFPHRGGMETHLSALCEGLSHSVDIQLIVANDDRNTKEEIIDGMHAVRAGQWFRIAGASICPDMVDRIRRSDAELVHLHLPNPTAIMAFLASGHKGRLVFTYHSDIVRQRILGNAFGPLLRRALDRSSAVIVSSAAYAETSPVLSKCREKCHVIPFGIDTSGYEIVDRASVEQVRLRYGKPLVLSVGRLVYYKGLEYLIEAMAHVPAVLLIVGEGPLRPDLERLADKLRVSDRVRFAGKVEDVIPYYHAADVFVLPSIARSEAFGLVQLEAMACGTPVVNTSIPSGVPFVSLNAFTGLTVPPRDAAALAGAIRLLLEDPERRRTYGVQARRRVRDEFTKDLMIERTLRLYDTVLQAPLQLSSPAA